MYVVPALPHKRCKRTDPLHFSVLEGKQSNNCREKKAVSKTEAESGDRGGWRLQRQVKQEEESGSHLTSSSVMLPC